MILAVDFDRTLHTGNHPAIGAVAPYARVSMKTLAAEGHYIIIWTCRTGDLLLEAINWLLENDIPFSRVNDHNPDNLAQYGIDGKKIYADVYIDDKQVGGLPTWPEIVEWVWKVEEEQQRSKKE